MKKYWYTLLLAFSLLISAIISTLPASVLTEKGRVQLNLYRGEWVTYSQKISQIFKEAKL